MQPNIGLEQSKKILDKFKAGKGWTEYDYLELYKSSDNRHVKNWTFDVDPNRKV